MQDEKGISPARYQEAEQKLQHYASMHGQHILLLTAAEARQVGQEYHQQAASAELSPRERCDVSCKYVQFEAIAAALAVCEQYRVQALQTA